MEKPFNIYLTPDELKALKVLAAQSGLSRRAYVAQKLRELIQNQIK